MSNSVTSNSDRTLSVLTPGETPTRLRIKPLTVKIELEPAVEDCHLPPGEKIVEPHRSDVAPVTPASPAPVSRGPSTGPSGPTVPAHLELRKRQYMFYMRSYHRLIDAYRRQLRAGSFLEAAETNTRSMKYLAKAIKLDGICRAHGYPMKHGLP